MVLVVEFSLLELSSDMTSRKFLNLSLSPCWHNATASSILVCKFIGFFLWLGGHRVTINPWKRTLWSLLLVIFSKDSSQPPGAAHSANKDTLGYVYHSRDTAEGKMRSLCWNFTLIVSKIEKKTAKKCQKARKSISFIAAAIYFTRPFISAFWEVDARCSICFKTTASWPGSFLGSPFGGLTRHFKAWPTWGSHLVPLT